MSDKKAGLDQKRAAYKALLESEGGQLLVKWLNESVDRSRENAGGKSDPIPAWGELKFAEGMASVLRHMQRAAKPEASEH